MDELTLIFLLLLLLLHLIIIIAIIVVVVIGMRSVVFNSVLSRATQVWLRSGRILTPLLQPI